jgi:hypothetical protein
VWSVCIVPLVLAEHISPDTLSVVINAASQIRPSFEFPAPMLDGRQRDNYQKRPLDFLNTEQVFNVGNNLHSLIFVDRFTALNERLENETRSQPHNAHQNIPFQDPFLFGEK